MGGHAAQLITFTVSKDKPSSYTIDINGQQSSFTITGNTPAKNTINSATIVYMLLFGMILIVIVLAVLVVNKYQQ